jgi:hypothetical protein
MVASVEFDADGANLGLMGGLQRDPGSLLGRSTLDHLGVVHLDAERGVNAVRIVGW